LENGRAFKESCIVVQFGKFDGAEENLDPFRQVGELTRDGDSVPQIHRRMREMPTAKKEKKKKKNHEQKESHAGERTKQCFKTHFDK
jgi:hypothetical protein